MGSSPPRETSVFKIYSNKKDKNSARALNMTAMESSILCMKKLLLLSAILLGAATASQAGVRFNFDIGIPFPPPIVVAPRAPVCVEPPSPVYCPPPEPYCPPPQAYCPPVETYYPPSVVVEPPVIEFGWRHYRHPECRRYRDWDDRRWHHCR